MAFALRKIGKSKMASACYLIHVGLVAVITCLIIHYVLNSMPAETKSHRAVELEGADHSYREYRNYKGPLPYHVWSPLHMHNAVNGYLVGNASHLSFHAYPYEVDLRVIVMAFDRHHSLAKCLSALNDVIYGFSLVSVEVWLDCDRNTGQPHGETLKIAETFNFTHGSYQVHVQPVHVGIQGQWMNTWRPRSGTSEVALFLEDDMTTSAYAWRWLRAAHAAYSHRIDVSGFGLSNNIAHNTGQPLSINPTKYRIILYKLLCTWGFSPSPRSWRRFQNWFYESEQDSKFQPVVPSIALTTQWWNVFRKQGRERTFWGMWHIYYTHNSHPVQYTVLLNTPKEGLLAVNRHEPGLHENGNGKARDPLCKHWNESYIEFPVDPPKINYDGKLEKRL